MIQSVHRNKMQYDLRKACCTKLHLAVHLSNGHCHSVCCIAVTVASNRNRLSFECVIGKHGWPGIYQYSQAVRADVVGGEKHEREVDGEDIIP